MVYAAVTLLCSTLARSQVASGGAAFGVVILLATAGAIPRVGEWLPAQLLTWGTELALSQSPHPAWPALAVSSGIILVASLGAWVAFERQEL